MQEDKLPPVSQSELPPIAASSAPPAYAEYPRQAPQAVVYGTSEKLKGLYSGYHALNWAFAGCVLAGFLPFYLCIPYSKSLSDEDSIALVIGSLVYGFVAFMLYRWAINKFAEAMHWSKSAKTWAIVLATVGSLCVIIAPPIILQQMIGGETAKYGLKYGLFGISKRDYLRTLAQLEAAGV